MLHVWKVSGEELACIPLQELGEERCVAVLRRTLRERFGFPICLQELLHDSSRLDNHAILDCSMDIQFVLLKASSSPRTEIAEEFIAHAAVTSDLRVLRFLLDAGVDMDMKDAIGRTALTAASFYGRLEVVRLLLEAAADSHLTDFQGRTALVNACDRGHLEIVRLMIAHRKAEIWDYPDALVQAFSHGFAEILSLLLQAGCSRRMQDMHRDRLLLHVCQAGSLDMVEMLLDSGAISADGIYGQSMLARASISGRVDLVQTLSKARADPGKMVREFMPSSYPALSELEGINLLRGADDLPLVSAARNGHVHTVQLLLEARCDSQRKDFRGLTALHSAVEHGQLEITQLLLADGKDVNLKDARGDTPLIRAVDRAQTAVVKLLLAAGADQNLGDMQGRTALIQASKGGCVEVVRLLLEAGACTYLQDADGDTALMHACKNGHTEVVRLLLHFSTQMDLTLYCAQQALIHASSKGHVEIVRLLLEAGADKGLAAYGRQALACASDRDHIEVVCLLLEAGADQSVDD